MLKEIKKYLAITWNDPITDEQVEKSINEGIAYLNRIVGDSINFDEDLEAKALLKDYCRYVRNYSLEYYESNFKNKLIGLQYDYAINKKQDESSPL